MLPTADISDKYSDSVRILKPLFRDYGGVKSFSGKVKTIKTLDDNTKVRTALESEGNGDVLVIDGQASLNCALLGGNLAALASQNNWSGIIVNGCIRDSDVISGIDIGVFALSSKPIKSVKKGIGDTDIDLNFMNTTFKPGEFLYADQDGIIISKSELDLS